MAKKELIVDLKGLAVQFLDQNIPDFWFKKIREFFLQNKRGGISVYHPTPLHWKTPPCSIQMSPYSASTIEKTFVAQLLQAPTMSPRILTFAFIFSKVEQKDEAEGVCTRKNIKVK